MYMSRAERKDFMVDLETITEASKRIGVKRGTLRMAVDRGSVPHTRMGLVKLLNPDDVNRWYTLHRAKIEYRESVSSVGEKK